MTTLAATRSLFTLPFLGMLRLAAVLLVGVALVIVVRTGAHRVQVTGEAVEPAVVPPSNPVLTAAAPVVVEEKSQTNYLGDISIPKISVKAPIHEPASDDQDVMTKELERGVIHVPDTAAIGTVGNTVIAGHSSFYLWVKSDYKTIFKDLGKLEAGDTITFRLPTGDDENIEYTYRVTEKRIVLPDDQWIFEQPTDKSVLTMGTCWPVGTTLRRLMVRAELVAS